MYVLSINDRFFSQLFIYLLVFILGPPFGSSRSSGQIRAVGAILYHSQSHVLELHHSSGQRWILNPLSEVRDQTLILMDTRQVCYS